MSVRRNAALLTALTCGAGLVLAAPAHAASWKNVASGALAYDGALDRVDFADKNTGWAVGSEGGVLGAKARILRWTGKGWARQASPVGFTPTDVAVASARRAWIVGFAPLPVSLYWNGSGWAKVPYPGFALPAQVAAAPDGTAYSLASVNANAGGIGRVMRWTGSAWADAKVPLPPSSAVTAVDVRSRRDVWLAGTTSTGTAVTGFALHYDGSAWRRLALPGSMGTTAYQAVPHRIVALSARNVYILRNRQNAQVSNALLHWNGSTWRTVATPSNAAGIGLSSDGRGGVVMLPVTTGGRTRYMHYSGTKWTTVNGPSRAGRAQAGDLDHRPGTAGIVSVGTASASGGRHPFIEYFG
ncbi:hypothetical protein ACSNOI_21185 [Actinomadura kijaniata]|uniref:hypothetical protein n=1 Tax=Actinomadura kijaniata TaxID=46161 RepID=UPI003F1B56C8